MSKGWAEFEEYRITAKQLETFTDRVDQYRNLGTVLDFLGVESREEITHGAMMQILALLERSRLDCWQIYERVLYSPIQVYRDFQP